MISTVVTSLLVGLVAVASWVAANFIGKPIVALQEKRLEALKVAERYAHLGIGASGETRQRALTSLFDVANGIRAYAREGALATRLWCRIRKYDLECAAQALFGLAEIVRGEFRFPEEVRQNNLNAVFLSLGAGRHLSPNEVAQTRAEIAKAKQEPPEG